MDTSLTLFDEKLLIKTSFGYYRLTFKLVLLRADCIKIKYKK